ncbi:drug/metabolite transporter (DMT)-like permease [Bradyrhizobium sp. RT6a]|uniref:DMT family transporter n=1 Tax=Bradyrhizobium sp. RT6a TaxID=3156381 RepID=UPI0033937D49
MRRDRSSVQLPGVPLALGSALLFGAATPLSKLLLASIDPQMLAGLLYLGAGVGLAAVHVARAAIGLSVPEAPPRRHDVPWLIAIVIFGGILGPALLMLGLGRTSASSGSLMLNLESLATMGIAWLVFRENVDRRLLLGALAIVLGAIALSWEGQGPSFDAGAALIAGACLCWGIDNNLTRKLSSADPVVIAMIKGLFAGAANIAGGFWLGNSLPPAGLAILAAILGFFAIGVSLVFFVLGLRHLGTARTGAYFSLAPFIGALIALSLGDPFTPKLVVAALLMGAGLWLHLTERHEHQHVHEAIAHEHKHVHDEHHQHDHAGAVDEPHSHWHEHKTLRHKHPHYPDLHHRHSH